MSSQRFEGGNLDEALGDAARTLGVEKYQLRYHVVLEKRGFLGAVKRVVIEAEPDHGAPEPEPEAPQRTSAARPSRGGKREGRPQGRRGEHQQRRPELHRETFTDPEYVDEAPPAQGDESPDAAELRAWFEKTLELAELEMSVRTFEELETIVLRLYGPDGALFLSRDGELLDALQSLANKRLTDSGDLAKRVELDCGNFKQQRVAALETRARNLADQVRVDGREQLLPAMNPVERRIVHLALESDPDVTTESQGDGFFKRVAIVPRGAAEQDGEP